jgi:hypothetical protein
MRDPAIIEEELIEIGGMADDGTKLEQIIAWCATHPDEVPVAIRMLLGYTSQIKQSSEGA